MTIKIALAPDSYKVQFGDYGEFTVRPFGAGEEMEINMLNREALEAVEKTNSIDTSKQLSAEELADANKLVKEANETINRVNKRIVEITKRAITAEKPEAVDRLFNELTVAKIHQAMREAVSNA